MPIPQLNANGLLPVGIHDATLDEIRQRFGSFQGSDRRMRLFANFEQLVMQLRKSSRFSAIIVDGSFVTAKPVPEDIDVIVVLQRGRDWTADPGPSDYALVSRSALRRRFGFDAFLAAEGGADYERYVEFFGRLRETSSIRKGMLRIEL
jgi:hypothetical protein